MMKLSRHGHKGGVVIETILILVGLGLLGKAFMAGATTYKFVHLAKPVDGSIVSIGDHGFSANIQIMPSREQGIVFVQRGIFYRRQVGEQVAALYNPDNVSEAHTQSLTALWFDTATLVLGGFILTVWGFRMRAARSI